MPEALLLPGLDALAFAFAAVALALVGEAIVIGPLRGAASWSGGIPVVGGSLAAVLSWTANMVQAAINAVNGSIAQAHAQATNWWNWMVYNTVAAQFAYWFDLIQLVAQIANHANSVANWVDVTFAPYVYNGLQIAWAYGTQALSMVTYLYNTWIPELDGTIKGIEAGLSDALSLSHYMFDTFRLWAIDQLQGIEAGVRALDNTLTDIESRVIPQLRDDINARALERDLNAALDRVGELERKMALLWALSILAIAGADVIKELECVGRMGCDPLQTLLDDDLDARVTSLEINVQ